LKTFKECIEDKSTNEMAHISGIHSNRSFSLKSDWDNHFKNKSELLVSKLPKKYKIYKNMSFYFLVDENDEYLGSLELKDVSKECINTNKGVIKNE